MRNTTGRKRGGTRKRSAQKDPGSVPQHDTTPTEEAPPWEVEAGVLRTIGSTELRTTLTGRSARKPRTQLEEDVASCLSALMGGRVLAIDPSSGSEESQPGYALWEGGELKDSGYISIGKGDRISGRLYRLGRSLREDFQAPDVVVTENIPPFMGNGSGGSFGTRAVIHLHQSIGVIMSVWDVPLVRITPRTWRAMTPPMYTKTDEHDAIMLGWVALQTGRRMAGQELADMPPRLRRKLETGDWT